MSRYRPTTLWIGVCALALCIGSLGPWSTVLGETQFGFETYGVLTLAAGVGVFVAAVAHARNPRRAWPLTVMLALAITAAALAGYDWWDTRQVMAEVDDLFRGHDLDAELGPSTSVGWGVILVVAASFAVALTAVLLLVRRHTEPQVVGDVDLGVPAGTTATDKDVDPRTGVLLATWLRRAAGGVIDVLVVVAMWIPFVVWAATTEDPSDPETISDAGAVVILLALLFVAPLYQWLTIGKWGRTLGKAAVGVTVVRGEDAGRVSYARAMGRVVSFEALAFLGITLLLAILWPLWDARKQTLYDKMAGTVVVRGRRPA